jgi:hypothetical protein
MALCGGDEAVAVATPLETAGIVLIVVDCFRSGSG